MKTILLISFALFLSSCASSTYNPKSDLGTTCRPLPNEPEDRELKRKNCIDVNFGYDPVRFHYLPSWDRERLPSMPDLD